MTIPVPHEPQLIADVAEAAALLRAGELVALPTETVYGLGAVITDPSAVARIFEVKGRPPDHPLIVHLGDIAQLDEHARSVPDWARTLAAELWPGPLTLVVERSALVPDVVTGGRSTVGLRVPNHPVALELLALVGGGVAAPSANRFGRVSPTTAAHVLADLEGWGIYVLDGGECTIGLESTIVDCTGAEPLVLRVGGIPIEQLTDVLGARPSRWQGQSAPRAPGMLAEHYAPAARVIAVDDVAALPQMLAQALVGAGGNDAGSAATGANVSGSADGVGDTGGVDGADGVGDTGCPGGADGVGGAVDPATPGPVSTGQDSGLIRIGVLGGSAVDAQHLADAEAMLGDEVELIELEPAGEPDRFAKVLYDRLRQADRLRLTVLAVVLPDDEGLGTAIRDRVRRAAAAS